MGQIYNIKGVVVDAETGDAVFMAKVKFSDENGNIVGSLGAYTDIDGKFSVPVEGTPFNPPNLYISHVAYKNQMIPISADYDKNPVTVSMNTNLLDVVTITASKNEDVKKRNWLLISGISLASLVLISAIIYIATRDKK